MKLLLIFAVFLTVNLGSILVTSSITYAARRFPEHRSRIILGTIVVLGVALAALVSRGV